MSPNGVRILVVEDQEATRRLLREYLEMAGFEIVAVCGGAEALAWFDGKPTPPHLVLMDVQMPGVDGFQTTAMLRARGLIAPVVFLTALAMPGDRERCLAAGGNDYLSKPFRLKELDETIHRFLGASHTAIPS